MSPFQFSEEKMQVKSHLATAAQNRNQMSKGDGKQRGSISQQRH